MESSSFRIQLAVLSDADDVKSLVDSVIADVYPAYYPLCIVSYFQNCHDIDSIRADIESGKVFVAKNDSVLLGTITLNGNHLGRLYVSSSCHNRGIGERLLSFAESLIQDEVICLDSSLPALPFYEKRGYKFVSHASVVVDAENVLVWDVMEKQKKKAPVF